MGLTLGSILQSVGNAGSDVANARQDLVAQQQKATADALANRRDQLNNQLLEQRLAQSGSDPAIAAKFAAFEKLLGRPLEQNEKMVLLGLAPTPKAPTAAPEPKTDFELWHQQNPTGTVADWLKVQNDAKPVKVAPDPKTAFEAWRVQNPQAPISDWLQLQAKYRPTRTGAGGAGEPSSSTFDPSITAASMGRINPPSPTTKFGAMWWARAKEMGLDEQIRTRSFANHASVGNDLAKAQKAYNEALDKFNSWKSTHYVENGLGFDNPHQDLLDAAKKALDEATKGAAAATGAGDDFSDLGGTKVE